MKNIKKINKVKYILSLLGIFFAITVGVALADYILNTYSTGWRVDNGTSKDVWYGTDNDINTTANACVKVTNNSGRNLFVPTRTVAEKNAFCANATGTSCGTCTTSSPPSPPPPPGCTNYTISWEMVLGGLWDSDKCGDEGIPESDPPVIVGTNTCASGYTITNQTMLIGSFYTYWENNCEQAAVYPYTATCVCN